eukprot:411456-Amphidinium_carterae.1
MPRARRMGFELWWKPNRRVSDTQRDTKKAWADIKNRSLLHSTFDCRATSATCTWTCDLQL